MENNLCWSKNKNELRTSRKGTRIWREKKEEQIQIQMKMTFYFLFHSDFDVIVSTFWCFSLLMLCHLCFEHDLCYWSIASITKNKLLFWVCYDCWLCCCLLWTVFVVYIYFFHSFNLFFFFFFYFFLKYYILFPFLWFALLFHRPLYGVFHKFSWASFRFIAGFSIEN